jgi:uncharacterized protein YPO0396
MMRLNQHASPAPGPEETGLPASADLYELITITARLKDVLVRESEHLRKMEMQEVGRLQDEKGKLTKLMESYQRLLSAKPELVRQMDEASREDLAEISEEFSRALADNQRRTTVARAINQRVVQAIMEVVTENQHVGTYNKYGSATAPSNLAVSFNLNERA